MPSSIGRRANLRVLLAILGVCAAAGAYGGALTGNASLQDTPGTVQLTAVGTADWAHWGLATAQSLNRQAAGGSQITNLSTFGGATLGRFGGNPANWSTQTWADGTPSATAAGFPGGVWLGTPGGGYEMTAPADTQTRQLTLYLGGANSTSELRASLSDGSAPDYVFNLPNHGGGYHYIITLTYQADIANQTLTVRHTQQSGSNIAIQAAALAEIGNAAPIQSAIGNRAVVAGSNLSFNVTAADPDGPNPLVLSMISGELPAGATYSGTNGANLFSWSPTTDDVGTYAATFRAADGAGAFAEETISITVSAPGSSSLTGTATRQNPPGPVNLTTEGQADWIHWGLTGSTSVNRKATGGAQISNVSAFGGATLNRFSGNPANWSNQHWTDGTPTSSQNGFPGGLYAATVSGGYELTAPADTQARTFTVYLGGFNSTSEIRASLSDGSAPDYVFNLPNHGGGFHYAVSITYQAASAGQTLTLRHTLQSGSNIGVQAATLSTVGNLPPVQQPIGNRTVAAGSTLNFSVTAVDPDGPAPLNLSMGGALPVAATYTEGGGSGLFTWTPDTADIGTHVATFRAEDGAGASDEETINITVTPTSTGNLSASTAHQSSPGTNSLTAVGTSDWVHWGLTSTASENRKATGGSQISTITTFGGATLNRFGGNPANWTTQSWTDGAPTAATPGFPGGLYAATTNGGYEFSAPADTQPRQLRVYLGGSNATSRIEASLSDSSAPDYVFDLPNLGGGFHHVVTINYQAASAGQTLTFRHTLLSGSNIAVQAAALSAPGTNQPPEQSHIGNRTVTIGSTLNFTVTATDPDGPPPIVMDIANADPPLPGEATYVGTDTNGESTFSWTPAPSDVGEYNVTFRSADGALATDQELITITVDAPQSGTLSGSAAPQNPPSTINLTAEGPVDWAHWGLTNASTVNRKASGGSQIGSLTTFGGATLNRFFGNPSNWTTQTWSDGNPTANQAGFPGGLYANTVGGGYQFSVPADTQTRVLKVYLGGAQSTSEIRATLSDGSAPDFVFELPNLGAAFTATVTITYRAASNGQTLTLSHELLSGANIAVQAAALSQPLALPFADNFDDGDAAGWLVVDETPNVSRWTVESGRYVQRNRIQSVLAIEQSYHLGTLSYLASGMDLTDYEFNATGWFEATGYQDSFGVVFRYQDALNYYRLTLNRRYGFTRLEKQVNGVFTPLATNAMGYSGSGPTDFRIVLQGSTITVEVNSVRLFAITDTDLRSGTVGLFTQEHSAFDNVLIQEPGTQPDIVLGSPVARLTQSGAEITATAVARNVPAGGYVSFGLNSGGTQNDFTPPFTATFTGVPSGNRTVTASLHEASGNVLDVHSNSYVGVGGNLTVGIGDSLTDGVGDNHYRDNITTRIVASQGYAAPLTDLLDSSTSTPTNLVFNEGIGGDQTFDTANLRIDSILLRQQSLDRALIGLGTNDALASIPSGAGCTGTACLGTFKGNLQALVDKVRYADYPSNSQLRGVNVFVAEVPPVFGAADPYNTTVNARIRGYNQVIRTEIAGVNPGPDLYGFFQPDPANYIDSLYADTLHPNALGYQLMATLWHNALETPIALPFILNDLASNGTVRPKQNLLDTDGTDRIYLDEPFTLTSAGFSPGARWIITNNADRTNPTSNFVTFTLDRAAVIYVGVDASATALPGWMAGYANTGTTFATSNPLAPTFDVYARTYPAGPVSLGGAAHGSPSGIDANLIFIVVESS